MTITCIVVDDNYNYVENIFNALEEVKEIEPLGYASTGKEALDNLLKMDLYPDIMTVDINMPEMDGITLIKELKKCRPKTLIVVITKSIDEEMIKKVKSLNVSGIIHKPFQPTELMDIMYNLIEVIKERNYKKQIAMKKKKTKFRLKIDDDEDLFLVGKVDGPRMDVKDISIIDKSKASFEPTTTKFKNQMNEDVVHEESEKPAFSGEEEKTPTPLETEEEDDDLLFSIDAPSFKTEGSKKIYEAVPEKPEVKEVKIEAPDEKTHSSRIVPKRAEEIFKAPKPVEREVSPDDTLFIPQVGETERESQVEKDENIVIAIRPPKILEGMDDEYVESADYYNPPTLKKKKKKEETKEEKGIKGLIKKLFKN